MYNNYAYFCGYVVHIKPSTLYLKDHKQVHECHFMLLKEFYTYVYRKYKINLNLLSCSRFDCWCACLQIRLSTIISRLFDRHYDYACNVKKKRKTQTNNNVFKKEFHLSSIKLKMEKNEY